ncbi:MAG: methyltransferase, partial [Bryobacteraceae bacterium]
MSQSATSAPPPPAVMMQLLNGKHIAYCLSALARLGVADHMTAELRSAEDIAAASGVHAPSLYRVLRMLASVGVFAQDGRSFGLTPVSDLLRTGAPGSLRYLAWTSGDGWATSAVANLDHCLLTGEDGVTKAYGKSTFAMMAEHPDQLEVFQRAMSNLSA